MEQDARTGLNFLSGKTIIVSGAGIAGLSFVISLRLLWITEMGDFPLIKQYERDNAGPIPNREGYSLSIRSGGSSLGMQALQKMGLMDTVIKAGVLRDSDEAAHLGLWTTTWARMLPKQHPALSGLPRSPLRIARTELRLILLDASEQQDKIHWGTACTTLLPSTDGRVRVQLSNGEEDDCDLLVVADGANSKLRASIISDDGLNFAGPVSISAVSRFTGYPPAPVDRSWGLIPSGQGVSLFVSPMGKGNVNWCISYLSDSPRKEQRQPMPRATSEALIEEAKERGAGFQEPFGTLVEHSDINTLMVFNAMDRTPFGHGQADSIPDGIIFIGDSNHAVSAFAANGANLALNDGYDLAECLCMAPSLKQAVKEYDHRSMPRAAITVADSRHHIALVHSSGLAWYLNRSYLLILGVLISMRDHCRHAVHSLAAACNFLLKEVVLETP